VNDFIEEAAAFPRGAHDYQVDAMTQLLLKAITAPCQPVCCLDPYEFQRMTQISPI
jgi:hypothetical protein